LNPTTIAAQVAGVRELTPRVREYQLVAAPGQALARYDPGAHIALHLTSPELGAFVRHYSLVGGPADGVACYRIAVQREDRAQGSDFIHRTFAQGTRLQISAPRNNFLLGRNDARSLLIAGGIGITPIYAMLASVVRRNKDFAFVYSGRTAEQLAYRDEAMQLAGARGRLHLSGEDGANLLDLRALLAAQGPDTTAYVCGPAGMVQATHQAAATLGWEPGRVRSEFFGVAGSPHDVAFEVHLAKSGRCISVGRNSSILEALTAAGVELLYDCRRGECGLCPLTVLAADGPIEHRDRYLSAEERAAGNTLCLCVSRIQGQSLTLDA